MDQSHPLAPYPSPEARDRELETLVAARGGELVHYGDSVEGRALLAGRLPAASGERAPAPAVLVTGNIHGPEFVSSRVAMGVLAWADQHDDLRRLRARAELWVIPCVNPDGYAHTWQAHGQGRLAALRANARGVDLNRNFPLPVGAVRKRWPGAGSSKPGAATYTGPAPLSEPESARLAELLRHRRFVAGSNGHSFMGRTIPPRVLDREDFCVYQQLCRSFAAAQPRARYGRLASRHLDTFTGELEDFQHHELGMWTVCVESFPILRSFRQHLRAPNLFFRFNPRDPQPWVDNDVPAIAAFLNAALAEPRAPKPWPPRAAISDN